MKWREVVRNNGLEHTLRYDQVSTSSSNYEDLKCLEVLDKLHEIQLFSKLNTFDEVKYTKRANPASEELLFLTLYQTNV